MAAHPVVPTPELQLTTEKNPGETVVRSAGRITSSSSGLLQNTVRALIPGTKRIVLDLKDISYIDSSGIGALVSVYMTSAAHQGPFRANQADRCLRESRRIPRIKL